MYESQIHAYFDNPEVEKALIEAISRLVSIRSVREEPQPGMPFGPGPARALQEALALCSEMGFSTQNIDGYVGTADLNGEETALHILAHVDVVGEGTGWTVTEPYTPKLVDGILYGRGVSDDKGPLCAALFAMKAIRDLGLPLRKNAKLIMGTDEESGFSDMKYYYARHPYAPYSFSPDAEFPLIHIEKGSYKPEFTATWPEESALPRVSRFHGGFRINVLPADAEALVEGMSESELLPYCQKAAAETGVRFTCQIQPQGVLVHCHGVGAHASVPEKGNNAITALIALLCSLPLASSKCTGALHSLNRLFPHGDGAGEGLGVAQADQDSGPLTLCFSLLEITPTGLSGQFDARVPICATNENCRQVAEKAFSACGFSCTGEMGPAHHTPADSPIVKTLLSCYERYTGECDSKPLAIGGGTYVHDIPGGVAFGSEFPDFSPNAHGADERTRMRDLILSCKIYAQSILELCQ